MYVNNKDTTKINSYYLGVKSDRTCDRPWDVNKNCPNSLTYLNTWTPVGSTAWEVTELYRFCTVTGGP